MTAKPLPSRPEVDDTAAPSSVRPRYSDDARPRPSGRRRRTLSARALESKAETKRALIEAGACQFREFGFDRPSLDSICADAGYTRGAFYVHFGTRENLICAVTEAEVERAERQITYCTDAEESLSALLGRLFAQSDLVLSTAQRLDACVRFPELGVQQRESLQNCVRYVAEVLQRAAASGEIRADLEFENVAFALLSLSQGAQILSELGVAGDPADLQRSVSSLLGR